MDAPQKNTRGRTRRLTEREWPNGPLGPLTAEEHQELWQIERDVFTSVFELEKREQRRGPQPGNQRQEGEQEQEIPGPKKMGAKPVFQDNIGPDASELLKAAHSVLRRELGHVRDKSSHILDSCGRKNPDFDKDKAMRALSKHVRLLNKARSDFRNVYRGVPLEWRNTEEEERARRESLAYIRAQEGVAGRKRNGNWLSYHKARLTIETKRVEAHGMILDDNGNIALRPGPPAPLVPVAPPNDRPEDDAGPYMLVGLPIDQEARAPIDIANLVARPVEEAAPAVPQQQQMGNFDVQWSGDLNPDLGPWNGASLFHEPAHDKQVTAQKGLRSNYDPCLPTMDSRLRLW